MPRDTVRADTLAQTLPDSVRRVFAEQEGEAQEEAERRVQAFPARRHGPATSFLVIDCDHECIQASPSLTLTELLLERVPGLTPLRAGYFDGPHFALQGPFGPGAVQLLVDGRDAVGLEAAQADLLRVSLVYLEHVRVYRRADGLLVEVSTRRHDDPTAYSRIAGGSGSPRIQTLNAIFTNGLARSLTVAGAFDLLDTTEGGDESGLFDFWGQVSWMPGSNRAGLQLDYRSQVVTRVAADTVEFNRRDYVLRGRADLPADIQAEVYAGRISWRLEGEAVRDLDQYGLEVAATPGRGSVGLGLQLLDSPAHPSVDAHLRGGYQAGDRFGVQAEARLASWEEFSTSEFRAAARYAFELGLPVVLQADAATGSRGIPDPLRGVADSVSFDAVAGSAEVSLGSARASGRLALHDVSRQVPFNASFDSLLSAGPAVDFLSWEVSLDTPLIPLGALIDGLSPIRLIGWWRRAQLEPEGVPRYVPQDQLRGELRFHDSFFDGNLELWLSGTFDHRASTLSAQTGRADPFALPAYTWLGGHFMIKIADLRIFLRLANPGGAEASEVGGIPFPKQMTVFGVRWTFFN